MPMETEQRLRSLDCLANRARTDRRHLQPRHVNHRSELRVEPRRLIKVRVDRWAVEVENRVLGIAKARDNGLDLRRQLLFWDFAGGRPGSGSRVPERRELKVTG